MKTTKLTPSRVDDSSLGAWPLTDDIEKLCEVTRDMSQVLSHSTDLAIGYTYSEEQSHDCITGWVVTRTETDEELKVRQEWWNQYCANITELEQKAKSCCEKCP